MRFRSFRFFWLWIRLLISIIAGLSLGAKKGNGAVKLSMAVADAVPISKSLYLDDKKSKNNKNPIIVIDNYDSFTYNLCQVCCSLFCFLISIFDFFFLLIHCYCYSHSPDSSQSYLCLTKMKVNVLECQWNWIFF